MRPLPTWIVAIVVTLVLQTVTAGMGRLVPAAHAYSTWGVSYPPVTVRTDLPGCDPALGQALGQAEKGRRRFGCHPQHPPAEPIDVIEHELEGLDLSQHGEALQ